MNNALSGAAIARALMAGMAMHGDLPRKSKAEPQQSSKKEVKRKKNKAARKARKRNRK